MSANTSANASHWSGSSMKAREGMSMIREIELPKGIVIYRFYDTSRAATPPAGAAGAWWMEFEYFQKIKHFAEQHGYSFSYATRLFAAILYEWSGVNAFVACELLQPLSAWKGRGKQVEAELGPQGQPKNPRDLPRMTPMQSHLEIYQLCVPGLTGPNSLASTALRVVRSGPVY